ncbi:MAG TPA: NUDIX domain-containing protein [Candidatus Microsaccharimonas sp.]|nr:NUDIX domain-containing protein [Candidatus Microsaccharimonas sp.]
MNANDLQEVLKAYLQSFPTESFEVLGGQLMRGDVMNNRQTLPGHVTGSAFVLSPDRTKLLLVKHKVLQMWFQPGGHWDPGEADPLAAAQREAEEETAVTVKTYLALDPSSPLVPMDIDSHVIPANPQKDEPEHWHHDFRYVFVAANEDFVRQETEVDDIGWFALDTPQCQALGILAKLQARDLVKY